MRWIAIALFFALLPTGAQAQHPDCRLDIVRDCRTTARIWLPVQGGDLQLCIDKADYQHAWTSADQAMQALDSCLESARNTVGRHGSVGVFVVESDGSRIPLGALDTTLATPQKPKTNQDAPGALLGKSVKTGALAEASIFLSAGHGWRYSDALERWGTQRGNSFGVIEDHTNAEALNQFLIPLLERAGARVYTARERDARVESWLLDDNDPVVVRSPGWQAESAPSAWGGSHLVHGAAGVSEAFVFYPFEPTIDGPADVYVWHAGAASPSSGQVRIEIFHAAGKSVRDVDQSVDFGTWRHIGRYMFRSGEQLQGVRLSAPPSASAIGWFADAVRFGGGLGDVVDPVGGTASGHPRWEESGLYHAGYLGYPNWQNNSTVNAMPRWAAWEHEDWEQGRSVYVSWHSNASGSQTARGTSSFAYSSSGFQGPFTGIAGSLALRNSIHARIVSAIHGLWDGEWNDRGLYTDWFAEINPNHNPKMPSSLHEIAFHTSPADANSLLDPRFRAIVARAVYQGIQQYFNENVPGYTVDVFLPDTPTHLSVACAADGSASLSWQAAAVRPDRLTGDAAERFRVYRSKDARDFTVYTQTDTSDLTLQGLMPMQPVYFRVTAENAAGESLPSEVLGCVPPVSGNPSVVLVSGFDRFDRGLNAQVDDPYDTDARSLGLLERMNTRDYSEQYLQGLAAIGVAVDSISNEALVARGTSEAYQALVWVLGEESSIDKTFDSEEQSIVSNHLDAGGLLLVSGSEIAWELDHLNVAESFMHDRFGVAYAADDAGVNAAEGFAGSLFDGLSLQFGGDEARYPVEWPDAFATTNGSSVVLQYPSAPPKIAGILYEPDGGASSVITLGFPIESIEKETDRRDLLRRVFEHWDLAWSDRIFADDFEPESSACLLVPDL